MRVFVTGGTGFLGSHIIDACLARGYEVRALVRVTSDTGYLDTLPVEQVVGDLGAVDVLARALEGVDVVHHSAARVFDWGSRRQFVDANVTGTDHLLEACRRAGVPRFVFVSSPSVIQNGRDQVDIDESVPYPSRFLNLYCETKALAEQRVLAANGPDLVTCALRPRGIWGPRDLHGAMPRILKRLRDRRLPDVSGGRSVHADITYAGNAAHACLLAAESDAVGGKAYFITDDDPIDVFPFCDELADRFGLPRIERTVRPDLLWGLAHAIDLVWALPFLAHRYSPPMSRYMASLLIHHATYDISAARRDLGYAPIVSREEGFAAIHAWLGDGGTERFLERV